MTIEKTVTQVYEKLFDHCFPAYALQMLDLDRVLMGRLSLLCMRSTLRHARRTRCVALFKTVHAERKEQKELLAKATRTWQGYRRLREGAHWLHQRQEEPAAERHSQCRRVSWRHVRVLVGAFRSNALP